MVRAALILLLAFGGIISQSCGPRNSLQPARESTGTISIGSERAGATKSEANRSVYRFSLVPGGTLTPAELRSRPDQYARRFYGDLNYESAVLGRSRGGSYYNSYRIGNAIYQKSKRSQIPAGEPVIIVKRKSGETALIRARCGNLLLDKIVARTQPESDQPGDSELDNSSESPTPPANLSSVSDAEFKMPNVLAMASLPMAGGPPEGAASFLPEKDESGSMPPMFEGLVGGTGSVPVSDGLNPRLFATRSSALDPNQDELPSEELGDKPPKVPPDRTEVSTPEGDIFLFTGIGLILLVAAKRETAVPSWPSDVT